MKTVASSTRAISFGGTRLSLQILGGTRMERRVYMVCEFKAANSLTINLYEQPLRDSAGAQLAEEQCQQQATSTKQADGVTHAQRCAPGKERDQVPHGRGARGVHSLIFDARGNRLANELSRRDYVTASTAKTGGDSTDAALEQQLRHTSRCETTGADGPDSAWKPRSCKSPTKPSKSLSRHRDRCRSFRGSGRLLRYRGSS